jgi:hypothetical protein
MRRALPGLACGCLLLGGLAVAFFHFGLVCWLVPCDRGVQVAAVPAGVPPGTECEVELAAAGAESGRVRRSPLTDGVASFVVGWPDRPYRARLLCGELPPTAWREVAFADDGSADLGVVSLPAP